MKPRRILSVARLSFPLASAIAALLAAPSASATAFFWDGTTSTVNADGGAGTWNTTTTNWDTLATAGTDIAWTNGNQAVFAGTAGTVTLGSAITVSGNTATSGTSAMYFTTSGYIVGGTNTISTTAASTFRLNNTTFQSGVTLALGLDRTLTLNITGTTNSIAGLISGTGTSGVTIANTGTLTLSNTANTYTGLTNIGNNVGAITLQVTKLANLSQASSLGAPTSATNGVITIGNTSNSSTLELVGGTTASVTDRQVRIGGNNNGAGNATILNNNTDVNNTLIFTNPAFNLSNATTGSNRSLTLGGSNAGANEIQGAIINNANNVGVSVNGSGAWRLSGNNTYSSATTVSGTATLTLSGNNSGAAGGVTLSTATTVNSPRLNVNSATALGTGTLTFGGGLATDTVRLDNTSVGLVSVSTNNVFTLNRDFTFIGTQSLDLGNMTTTLGGLTSGTSRNITVTANTLTFGGAIGGAVANLGVNKLGAGTLTLSGANSYGGNTTVNGGTVKLGNARGLGFGGLQTTATGTTTVASGFTLDLNGATNVNEPIILSGTGIGGNGALTNSGAAASISNGIAGIQLPTATTGSGYSAVPTVTITGTGTLATATATLGVTGLSFTAFNGGDKVYTVAPTVTISGGGGIGATATAILSGGATGTLTGFTIINVGTGFTTAPTVTFGAGTFSSGTINGSATGNATEFTVSGVSMTAAGSGYTGTPTYTFSSGNAVAGTATLSSVVLAANSSVGGAGDIAIDAVVSESGGTRTLTKVNAGKLTLTGANTYAGTTTLSGGTLALAGTGSINTSSGITINGSGTKFLQTSSVASTPDITQTLGTLTGSGTVGNVAVANSASNIISNNDGVAGAALTIGALTFNGSATVNTFSNSTSAPIVTTTLATTSGTVTLNASNASWTIGTPYDLISYTGGSIGGAGFTGRFALGTVSNATVRQTKTLLDSGTAVTLTVGANDTPVWSGAGSTTWTTATFGDNTGPNAWALKTGQTATNFWLGDDVEFNDTYNLGAGDVTVANSTVMITGGVAPMSTTFNNSGVNYAINSSDSTGITSGFLTKNGTGTVTLSTNNSYAGATTLNLGILRATTSANALGAGTLTVAGGELQLANDTGLNFGRNTTVTGNAQITSDTLTAVAGVTQTLGTLSIGGQTLTIAKGSNATGTTAGVTFGATTLTGAPTFSIGTDSALNLAAVTNAGNTITLTGAGNLSQTGTLSGVGGLTLDSGFSGTATLTGTSTNYSGATTISGGKLVLVNASLSTLFASAVTVNAGGTLQYSPTAISNQAGVGAISLLGTLTYAPAGTAYQVLGTSGVNKIVTVSGGASVINISPGGIFAASSGGLYLDGGLQGSSALTVNATTDGFGLVLRTAGSIYSGTMIVNGNANITPGTGSGLVLNGSGVNSTLSNATLTINGTLELGNNSGGMGFAPTGTINGTTQSINALNGSGVVVANMSTAGFTRTLSVGNNGGTGNFSGVIANGINNTLSFIKAGSGTQTLSGLSATAANNYSGITTVDNGTLAFTTTSPSLTAGLRFGSAATNTTPGILDLTTTNATFAGALLVNTNSATASEIKIGAAQTLTFNGNVQIGATTPVTGVNAVSRLNLTGGGAFNVATAAAGTFIVGGSTLTSTTTSQNSTLDLTALSATTINTSSTGTIRVSAGSASNVAGYKSTLLLPSPVVADTVATATLTAGTIGVGVGSGFNNAAGQINTIQLGTGLTTLNANTINVGTGSRDIGQIIFVGAGGDVIIRAADGTSRATALNVATGGATTATTEATTNNLVDFSGHDADILVTSLNVGNQARVGNLTSEFKFGAGTGSLASTLDATNVNVGFRTGTATATNVLTNRVILSGGSVTFGDVGATGTGVDIGNSAYSGAGAASTIGELNISGGTVTINNSTSLGAAVRLGSNVASGGGTVTASMNLTGGTTTLGGNIIRGATSPRTTSTVKISGGTLDMGGFNIGTSSTDLITLTAESGTLKNVGTINVNGGLTKTTAGTLIIEGANAYTGQTLVSNGTLKLNSAGTNTAIVTDANTATTSDILINGGTLEIALSEQIANTGSIEMTSGAFNFGAATGKTETIDRFTNSGGTFSTGANTLIGLGATITWSGGTNTVNDGGSVQDAHLVISGGTNTVEGGATGGVLQLNSGGAGLEMSAGSTLTLNSDNGVAGKLLLKGDVSTSGDSTVTIANNGANTFLGNIDLDGINTPGARTFTVANGAAAIDLSVSAVITNGALTKVGAGTMALTGASTYAGDTTITTGTLQLGAGSSTGSLSTSSAIVNNANLTINRSNAVTQGTDFSGADITGAGSFTQAGTGTTTLNVLNSYSGGTTVTAGTLQLSHNSAAGTAGIAVSGASAATLQIDAGITLAGNNITFSNTNAASSVKHGVAISGTYSTGTSGNLTSSFAGGQADTTAQILGGTSSVATTLEMLFAGTSGATNDAIRRSDVFTTAGTSTDTYVIQLSTGALAADSALAWLNGSNEWVHAGTTFFNETYSFAARSVGDYGYDSGNVWAVVNHGGSFTAVPEPTSALVGLLIGAGLLRRRRTGQGRVCPR